MKMFTAEQIQSLNELEMEVYLYVMKQVIESNGETL